MEDFPHGHHHPHHPHHSGDRRDSYPPPPPIASNNYYPAQPPPGADHPHPHHHPPHMPQFPPIVDHHSHHKEDEINSKPSVKMYCKADTNYSLTICDGIVVLAPANPSDPNQHWIKDEKMGTKVKDEEGLPSFALVNKATRQAMKHASAAQHPVQLIAYDPNGLDESILWTEKDLGDGFKAIRMVNNIRLNVDALDGGRNQHGVQNGTRVVLWDWKKGDNQRWKFLPHSV